MQNPPIIQIQEEDARIEDRWMELHKRINLWSVLTAFGVELLMFWVLYRLDIPTSTIPVYIFKYIVSPAVLNLIAVGILYLVLQNSKSRTLKKYAVSLCLVVICFILLIVHNIFPALHMLFGIPIILTTVYGDYRLTTTTALLGLITEIVGELLIFWDPDKVSIFKDSEGVINFGITLAILIFIYAISLVVLYYERLKNEASVRREIERFQLKTKLLSDTLTSLYNRTALQEHLDAIESSRDNFIFAMIDVDDFKKINDTLGHIRGDDFLKEFAAILKQYSEPHPAFRFAGDEFCILFKNEPMENVLETCHGIQRELMEIKHFEDFRGVTASFGIARYEHGITTLELLEHADHALYESKKNKGSITIYQASDGALENCHT